MKLLKVEKKESVYEIELTETEMLVAYAAISQITNPAIRGYLKSHHDVDIDINSNDNDVAMSLYYCLKKVLKLN